MLRPALFLDRDGTLIIDRHYLADPDGVDIYPGVAETLARAKELGYWVIVISNQSGVARGYMTHDDVDRVNARVHRFLPEIDAFFYCPHGPDDGCPCRKPGVGLIEQARAQFEIDMSRSVMVGDSSADVGSAIAAGVRAVLVRTGNGRTTEANQQVETIDSLADLRLS